MLGKRESPVARVLLSQILAARGDRANAIREIERALKGGYTDLAVLDTNR